MKTCPNYLPLFQLFVMFMKNSLRFLIILYLVGTVMQFFSSFFLKPFQLLNLYFHKFRITLSLFVSNYFVLPKFVVWYWNVFKIFTEEVSQLTTTTTTTITQISYCFSLSLFLSSPSSLPFLFSLECELTPIMPFLVRFPISKLSFYISHSLILRNPYVA